MRNRKKKNQTKTSPNLNKSNNYNLLECKFFLPRERSNMDTLYTSQKRKTIPERLNRGNVKECDG